MPRRLVRRAPVQAKPPHNPGVKRVQVVELETRPLCTVGPDNPVWQAVAGTVERVCSPPGPVPPGGLVRLQPPAGASPAKVRQVVAALQASQAAAVRVYRPLPGQQAPVMVEGRAAQPGPAVRGGGKKAVWAAAREMTAAAFTERKTELWELVERYLSKAEPSEQREHAVVDPGHLVGMRLENYRCYRGQHELALEPKVYALTARMTTDSERSNWLGKSTTLGAIVFALTGDGERSDEWITDGCDFGAVDLEFSSGLFISRYRNRGKSTQLEVQGPKEWLGAEGTATGAAAQKFLEQAVIDRDRLFKTRYFEQKATDQFLRMGPAELSATVNGWLDIDWVSEAYEGCMKELNALSGKVQQLEQKCAVLQPDDDDIETAIAACEAELEQAKEFEQAAGKEQQKAVALLARWQAKQEQANVATDDKQVQNKIAEWDRHKHRADEAAKLKQQIEELRPAAEVALEDVDMGKERAAVDELKAEAARLSRELKQAEQLSRGEFSGECPVAGIQCPAKQQINEQTLANKARLQSAKAAWIQASDKARVASNRVDMLVQRESRRSAAQAKLAGLETALAAHKADVDWIAENPQRPSLPKPDPEEEAAADEQARARDAEESVYQEGVQIANDKHREAVAATAEVATRLKRWKSNLVEQGKLVHQLEPLRASQDLQRQAALILGRSGVQRVVAEGSLSQIELMGNAALADAGIDLEFKVSWAEETKQLADMCEQCGAPFPASRRVKKCERCGAERKNKLSHGLRVSMANSSGGADDLAAVMFKLAAADWFGAQWGGFNLYLMDEVFGALDRANTRMLATHLARLLRDQFGARQAFVVAHDADVMDGMPGRLNVISDGDTTESGKVVSRLEVTDG